MREVFLRSGFCLTGNEKAFLSFLYTGCININIASMNNYNDKLNMLELEKLLKSLLRFKTIISYQFTYFSLQRVSNLNKKP